MIQNTQPSYLQTVFTASVTTSTGTVIETLGANGVLVVELKEVHNVAGDSVSVSLEGSFDKTTWYDCGYQQVDAIAAPARAVADIVTAKGESHVHKVLDPYPYFRVNYTARGGAGALTARVYCIPS